MSRTLTLAYGVACYLAFLAAFLYAVGFVGNLLVPKGIDSGLVAPVPVAVLVDTLLLLVFAVPHSVMARPIIKRWWKRFVPPPVERSTYVLVSSLALSLLFWRWRPVPAVVWQVTNPAVRSLVLAVFWAGWAVVLVSTFLIDHFDLLGLRQVFLYASGRPYTPVRFKVWCLYRYVRHPIMLGFLLAFWAAPTMTAGHLLFAAATTAYILIALRLEEQDLVGFHGERYLEYQRRTRMLLPIPKPKSPPN
jgi:protein-S-isoprenylcysteine O-methyltransferase Ste14